MNKILLYTDPTGEHFAWDISRKDLRDSGYLELFGLLDRMTKNLFLIAGEQLRDMARRGNPDFARAFLELHRSDLPGSFQEVLVMPIKVNPVKKTRKVECPEALALDMDPIKPKYTTSNDKVQVQLEGPSPFFDTKDRAVYHVEEIEDA